MSPNKAALRDGAEGVGGAAPGPHDWEAPALGRRCEDRNAASLGGGGLDGLLGGEAMALYYCDVHRTGKNGEGFRITFTSDGVEFRHADGFEEVPAKEGDKVFVDTLPLQHTDGAIGLLKRGVEIYYLRRPPMTARKREELKLSKTTRNDLRALMAIGERWFRKVSEDFLVMRRKIAAYRSLLRSHQQLLNKSKALSEDERNMLRPAIIAIEEQMEVLAKQIVDEACKRFPAYSRLVGELGIRGNAGAMEALAEIITYIDGRGFRKTANFFGLFGGRGKLYNGSLRKALQRLTASVNKIAPTKLKAKLEKETLYRVWTIYKQEAQGRLAVPAQG